MKPKPPAPNISAIARKYGIARNTLMLWRDQGLDLSDPVAVEARFNESKAAAPPEDLAESKARKAKADADMVEHKLAVMKGEFGCTKQHENEGRIIAGKVREVFLRLPDDLAPAVAGRTAAECKKILTKYRTEKLTELSHHKSPVAISP